MLAFQILEHLLLKTQAAPLKKALVDAQLGKDVLSMFNNDILQPTFSIILNGSNKEKKADFIKVITETLTELVENGIDKKLRHYNGVGFDNLIFGNACDFFMVFHFQQKFFNFCHWMTWLFN